MLTIFDLWLVYVELKAINVYRSGDGLFHSSPKTMVMRWWLRLVDGWWNWATTLGRNQSFWQVHATFHVADACSIVLVPEGRSATRFPLPNLAHNGTALCGMSSMSGLYLSLGSLKKKHGLYLTSMFTNYRYLGCLINQWWWGVVSPQKTCGLPLPRGPVRCLNGHRPGFESEEVRYHGTTDSTDFTMGWMGGGTIARESWGYPAWVR